MEQLAKRLVDGTRRNDSYVDYENLTPDELMDWMENDPRVAEELSVLFSKHNVRDITSLRAFIDKI